MIEMGGGKRFIATKLYIFLMVTNGMSTWKTMGVEVKCM